MKTRILLAMVLAVSLLAGTASATTIQIFVDSAPNTYGDPGYPSWQADAFADIAAGTFTNMRNGLNPAHVGTTNFMLEDEVVYSFGDLGKRLTWIYWIEGETVQSLQGKGIQVSLINIWDGDVLDFYDYYYGATWVTPTKIYDYSDGNVSGVFGLAGMAWWGAYGVNTQEALDADLAAWRPSSEQWIFNVRLNDPDEGVLGNSITSNRVAVVPEPATMTLLGLGLGGLALSRVRRRKAA